MRRQLLNVLLRSLVKPIWRQSPSIERMRERAARVDHLLSRSVPQEAVTSEGLDGGPALTWAGRRERVAEGAVLYLHGGAFCVHLPLLYRDFCIDMARRTGLPVLLPDYRLAPEHPAPAALDDCEAAYRHLLGQTHAHRIVLVGDSAGGNLALALMQRCKRVKLPLPAGAVLISPVTDFSGGGWSMHFNARRDVMFTPDAQAWVVGHYLPRMLADDPEVSPLFGDWKGLPPLRFHASSAEMLLDHSLRAVERAQMEGVDAQATVWLDLPHVFALFGLLAEAGRCRAAMARFITERLAIQAPRLTESG